MKIKDILRQKGAQVQTITPDQTIHAAMETLVKHNIGSLLVREEDGEIAGIITERDILRTCSAGEHDPKAVSVRDAMTKELIIGVPEDDLSYVMAIMTKNRIRHLPVVDEDGLKGIISIGDVVGAHLEEAEFENRLLKDYIHGVKA